MKKLMLLNKFSSQFVSFSILKKMQKTILFILIFTISVSAMGAQLEKDRKELTWYKNKKAYKNLKQVKEDLKNNILIHPPAFFEDLGITNVGAGEMDPNNGPFYWSARPETLGVMLEVLKEYKIRMGNKDVKLYIAALLRTLEYQRKLCQYNTWADMGRSTHTNGSTFDITIHPMFVKDIEQIDTLNDILKELHKKEEIFFIDEAGNSCFHVCVNPLYEKKYSTIFNELLEDYKLSSFSYGSNINSFQNKEEIGKFIEKGDLIQLSEKEKKRLQVNLQLKDNSEIYYSARPEIAALIYTISKDLSSLFKDRHFTLTVSELIRTEDEEAKSVANNPLLPGKTPFIYGMAFQLDGSCISNDRMSDFLNYLDNLKKSGDIEFVLRSNNKYDIVLKPEVSSKYALIYKDKVMANNYNYIIIGLVSILAISFTVVFLFVRNWLILFMKRFRKIKRRKKTRSTVRLRGDVYET